MIFSELLENDSFGHDFIEKPMLRTSFLFKRIFFTFQAVVPIEKVEICVMYVRNESPFINKISSLRIIINHVPPIFNGNEDQNYKLIKYLSKNCTINNV